MTEKRKCAREGCVKSVSPSSKYAECTFLCHVVATELERAQRICEVTGDGELWSAAVALSDALTEYRENDHLAYRQARTSGMSNEEWRVIQRG